MNLQCIGLISLAGEREVVVVVGGTDRARDSIAEAYLRCPSGNVPVTVFKRIVSL